MLGVASRMSTSGRGRPSVVHIVPALFGARGIVGGAERYAFELARHMADASHADVSSASATTTAMNRVQDAARQNRRAGPGSWRGQRANPFSLGVLREMRCRRTWCTVTSSIPDRRAAGRTPGAALRGRRVFCSDLGGGGWDVSAYVSTDRWFHGHLHISAYSRNVFGHAGGAGRG